MKYNRDNVNEFEYEFVESSYCEEYHCHNCIEIIYIKKGVIRLRTDMSQSVCDASVGDYAVIASSDVHRCFCMGSCEYELFRFPVSYQNLLGNKPIRNSFVITGDVLSVNGINKNLLSSICGYLKQDGNDKSVIRNLCSSLCSILVSFYGQRKKSDFATDKVPEDSDAMEFNQSISVETIEKFDKALDYIKENYARSKINLEILSNVSGLNKSFLSALFPKLTGHNFKDYLNRLRVDRAIELITASEKSISEIAFLCGFDTIRTLNNVFKSVAGLTPSAIRLGASEKDSSGIDTQISALGSKIFSYKWKSTVLFDNDYDNNAIFLHSKDPEKKCWCHLNLRMMFCAGREYRISYKAKITNSFAKNQNIRCNFCFPDDVIKIEHHSPKHIETVALEEGWYEYLFSYTVPVYYKPSSIDNFSVYSSPAGDRPVDYIVKDIVVELI